MNQNQGGNDARHDDDSALTDFLASLYCLHSHCMNFFCCLKTDFFIYLLNSYACICFYFLFFIFIFKISDELVEHYLGKSGFQCPDVRL